MRKRFVICLALVLALLCSHGGGLAEDGDQADIYSIDHILSEMREYREYIGEIKYASDYIDELYGIGYLFALIDNGARFSYEFSVWDLDLKPVIHEQRYDQTPGRCIEWSLGHSRHGEYKLFIDTDVSDGSRPGVPTRFVLVTQRDMMDEYFETAMLLSTVICSTHYHGVSPHREVAVAEGLRANTLKIDKDRWISVHESEQRPLSDWFITCEMVLHETTAEQSGYYEYICSAKWVG